jgi:hypothetical protein
MSTLITDADAPRFGQDGFAMVGRAAPSRGCPIACRPAARPGSATVSRSRRPGPRKRGTARPFPPT